MRVRSVAEKPEREYSVRRTDAALSIGYDVLVGRYAPSALQASTLSSEAGLRRAVSVFGYEVEPFEVDCARHAASARVVRGLLEPSHSLVGSDVEEDGVRVADVGNAVVQGAYQGVVGPWRKCRHCPTSGGRSIETGLTLVEPLLPAAVQHLDVGVAIIVENPPEAGGGRGCRSCRRRRRAYRRRCPCPPSVASSRQARRPAGSRQVLRHSRGA